MRDAGWARPTNSRKWHFFIKDMSVCGRWLLLVEVSPDTEGDHSSVDDCVACAKRAALIRPVQPEETNP